MTRVGTARDSPAAPTASEAPPSGSTVDRTAAKIRGASTSCRKINQCPHQDAGYFVDKLAKAEAATAPCSILAAAAWDEHGQFNQHLHHDVPHVLIGGANGKLKGGRHLAYPSKTVPTGNLLLSVLDMFDIHQDSIGDSTGRLENL